MKKTSSLLLLSLMVTSCASTSKPSTQESKIDPYESYNRVVFKMNNGLDTAIIRPSTVFYVNYIPLPIRSGINNFFNNLRDFVTLGNDVLQLKALQTVQNLMRISINSTFGMLGLIDISTSMGLPMQKNSFGKTFRAYGWKNSNYFIIPFFGPSTVRDALGLIPDIAFNPTWYINYSAWYSIGLYTFSSLDSRSKLLGTDQIIKASIDPYITVRDIYLQNAGQNTISPNNDININNLINEEIDEENRPATIVPTK